MSIRIFLSTVTSEFRAYRDQLRADLTRHNVDVKVQEDFKDLGGDTLDKLDEYIKHCDAVVHLIGDMCGSSPGNREQTALLTKHPDLVTEFPALGEALRANESISYTQWEAWLALHHGKLLLTAKAESAAPRGPDYAPTDQSRAAQTAHLARLEAVRRYPGCAFSSAGDLARHIAYTAILDLLVKEYAAEAAREREVAEGFIREMAGKVARDKNLDLEGMKQAVRNALDIYENEIAGGVTQTNIDAIVDAALAKAKAQVDKGQSGLARATLRRAAEEMRREEEERRERYAAGVSLLFRRERDIALAAYDGEAAASATMELARALKGGDKAALVSFLEEECKALHEFGDNRGSNVHLIAEISLRREILALAEGSDAVGRAQHRLGNALGMLGMRESGTRRLKEAFAAYRAALEQRAQQRVPLDWAATQNNIGLALVAFGERESGTGRLEEAVAAFRAALQAHTRERAPLLWAATQNNLGTALRMLGERTTDTEQLKGAVTAHRAALEEFARERAPLQWAATQNNLGNVLRTLGERESGTDRLQEAEAAFRAALEETTRERVPLEWAATQNNLGNALMRLGERESGTGQLEKAVVAYVAALEEYVREQFPLLWAIIFGNRGAALMTIAERKSDGALAETALSQIKAALQTLRAGGHAPHAAYFEEQLPRARALRDRLKGGGG